MNHAAKYLLYVGAATITFTLSVITTNYNWAFIAIIFVILAESDYIIFMRK